LVFERHQIEKSQNHIENIVDGALRHGVDGLFEKGW